MKGNKIAIDPDEALRLLDKLRKDLDELGRFIGAGIVTEQPASDYRRRSEKVTKSVMPETGFGIPTDGWTSYRTKGPAGPEEPGWRFASDRENDVHPEVEELVNRIWEQNRVEQGGFVYTLSKDSKFLQRNRAGKSGRSRK